jgi:hypothetical protein
MQLDFGEHEFGEGGGSLMKVKLFWKNAPVANGDKGAHDFEDEINAWLGENPRLKVVGINQSSSGGSFHSPLWFISI